MIDIRRVTDMQEILKVIPIEIDLKEKGKIETSGKDFLTLAQAGIDKPLFGFWIAYNDDKVVGYTCAIINTIKVLDVAHLFIIRFWTNKSTVTNLLLNTLIDWGKTHKVSCMRATTKRHLKPIARRLKFNPVSVIIERRI